MAWFNNICLYLVFFYIILVSIILFRNMWRLKWTTEMRAESTAICFLYVFLLIIWYSFCSRNEDKLSRQIFERKCPGETFICQTLLQWDEIHVMLFWSHCCWRKSSDEQMCYLCFTRCVSVCVSIGSSGQVYIHLID